MSSDDFLIEHNIHAGKIKLIKLDIQGSEVKALKGMEEFLKKYRPKIILEYSPIHLKLCGASPFDVLSFIDRYDYIPFQIREEFHLSESKILNSVNVHSLIEVTEFLFTTSGWGIDLLLQPSKNKRNK